MRSTNHSRPRRSPLSGRERTGAATSVPNRKALQLCKQVERTLSLVLAGETGDPVLHDVLVAAVTPAPNAGQLLVTLQLVPSAAHDGATVQQHVLQASRLLRAEVAHAIHRRKVPELLFRVLEMPLR